MFRRVSENDFIRAFDEMGRANNFTMRGRQKLFELFEYMDDSTGGETELDVIAICCDFAEYDADELLREYGDHIDNDGTVESLVMSLIDETIVVEVDDLTEKRWILQAF